MISLRRALPATLVVGIFLTLAGTASAASFTVNDPTDAALANPAGTACESTNGGSCTLRAAVQAADNAGGASTITVPAGEFKLTIPSTGADDPASGDLDVKSGTSVTLTGAGAGSTTLNANHVDREFAVQNGASLSVSGVTIEHGAQPDTSPSDNSTSPGRGGAIYNDGFLFVDRSVLTGNSADFGGGVVFSDTAASATSITNSTVSFNASDDPGGAIEAYSGTITLTGDTISHNSADSEGGVLYADDAGHTVGAVTVANTTLTNNSADGEGGVLKLYEAGALTISNSNLSDNTADSDGGAIYDERSGPISITGSAVNNDTTDASDGGALYEDASQGLTVKNSSFNNDYGSEGGAIYKYESGSLVVESSTFDSNSNDDTDGGAIYDEYGEGFTVTNSSFVGNSASDSSGGAIYEYGAGFLNVSGSTFKGNSAGDSDGGAIYQEDSSLSVRKSSFTENHGCCGGALYARGKEASTPETITESSFTDNSSCSDEGGAIYDDEGNMEVTATTFANNSSCYYGGALYYDSSDGLSLNNDTFDGNQGVEGGGIYLGTTASTGSINLLNDTIAGNVAYEGGGIYHPGNANSIENTIVANNSGGFTSSGGGDCYGSELASAEAADKSGNIDSDGTCFSNAVFGDMTGVNPLLSALAANGGPVETDALIAGSPAIGRAVAPCPATDARGVPRPSSGCDSGAYQHGLVPSITIGSPTNGATYTPGQVVKASYSCVGPAESSITSCAGTVANGAAVDTSTFGTHTFTVQAADSQFAGTSQSVTYTVAPAATPPSITNLTQSHKRWREGTRQAKISKKKLAVGTTFSFRLNESANVTFTFIRHAPGRKVHHRCVAPTKHNKNKPSCSRTITAGTMTLPGHAGTDTVVFDGRLGHGVKLKDGSYGLLVSATAFGEHSATRTLHFTIVKH